MAYANTVGSGWHSRDHLHQIVSDQYKEADIDLDLYGTIRR